METETLFDSHNDLLLLAYKILGPVSSIVNMLGCYLIVFKSTREMSIYRWHLLHYQIWAMAYDVLIIYLSKPVLYFPLLAGKGHGILVTQFGVQFFTCFEVFVFLQNGILTSILELFFYRYQCVALNEYKLTNKQFHICIGTYFSITTIIPILLFQRCYVDPSFWSETLKRWNPRALELLNIPNVAYVPLSEETNLFMIVYSVFFTIGIVITLGFIVNIQYILLKQSVHLTLNTRKLQHKFLIALISQVVGPLLCVFFPAAYSLTIVYLGILDVQAYNNITTLILSSHGIISTLFLIYFNSPYRIFVSRVLKTMKDKRYIPVFNLTRTSNKPEA